MKIYLLRIPVFLITVLFWSAIAIAGDDKVAKSDADRWKVEVNGYVFMTKIDGDLDLRQTTTDVDIGFSDILKNLDLGAMAFAHAAKGPWLLTVDGAYLKLSDKNTQSRNNVATVSLDAELEQTVIEGFVGYRIFDRIFEPNNPVKRVSVHFNTGARYNRLKADLSAQASVLGLSASADRQRSVDWVDPLVGFSGVVALSHKAQLRLWTDYGGFGVGSDSTWQVVVGGAYNFDNGVNMIAGYRAFSFDYSEGEGNSRIGFDFLYTGPMLGFGYRF
jgi:hypothetical protein